MTEPSRKSLSILKVASAIRLNFDDHILVDLDKRPSEDSDLAGANQEYLSPDRRSSTTMAANEADSPDTGEHLT